MANSVTAALPQYWALEGLRMLREMTPAINAFHREFSSELARAGDTVNAWRADARLTRRKDNSDENTETDANLTAVPVKLDQYFFDAIVIHDEDEAKTLPELTQTFLPRMIETIANGANRALLGQVHAFLRQGSPLKRAGRLEKMTKSNASDFILEAEEVLTGNLAGDGLRLAIVHHTANTKLMGADGFEHANERGQPGTIMTGEVGTVYNTRIIKSQAVNYVYKANADTQSSTINNSGGYAAGTTSALTVVDPGTDWTAGEYVTIDGNDQPTYVQTTASATSITLNEELKYAVADGAAITHYVKSTVNNASGYAVGYKKDIVIDGHQTANRNLQKGQILSTGGVGANRRDYTIIEVRSTGANTTTVLLDRPLEVALADNDEVFPGPAGSMNPVFDREAMAFVSRPMQPKNNSVTSAVANFDGLGIRVQMQDELKGSGTRVVVDLLCGIKPLDTDLLCVMLA